jgi:hypothetical protein
MSKYFMLVSLILSLLSIFLCGVIILLFLIVMGLLMGGLVDMEDHRLP